MEPESLSARLEAETLLFLPGRHPRPAGGCIFPILQPTTRANRSCVVPLSTKSKLPVAEIRLPGIRRRISLLFRPTRSRLP